MSHHRSPDRYRGRNRRTENVVCSGTMINRILDRLERIVGMLELIVPGGSIAKLHKISRVVKRQRKETQDAVKRNT